jgi:hypothetical protein
MQFQRLYIYRCGATNVCALTGEKGDARLPTPLASDRWQFWMQISLQTDSGIYGFGPETALAQITGKGFYLFTGSIKLLSAPALSHDLQHHQEQSMSDAPFTRPAPAAPTLQ